MIAHVEEFEKKLSENGLNMRQLAKKIRISPATLTAKLKNSERNFKLSEMIAIAQITEMSEKEFIYIFFGEILSSNESLEQMTTAV